MNTRKLALGLLLILPVILSSCGKEESREAKIIRPVKAMRISQPESTIMRVFPGVALASNETTLAFQVPGQIIKLPVLEGDQVSQGGVIAELDAVKYQESVNDLAAKLARDKGNYDRANTLVKSGHISIADYDKVKSAWLSTQANYNSAMTDLKNTRLIAPFSGVIAKKYVKNYEYITAKQPIVLLQDRENIDLEINVPENVIVNMKSGKLMKEKIYASFDAVPGKEFPIGLKEYSSQADPQTQTFRIVFTMKRPQKVNILPGMTASIHAPLGSYTAASFYLIPSSAVFMNAINQPSVWLIDQETMTVKSVPVKVSSLTGDQIRVLSGLEPGEMIVTSGVNFLNEGEEVKILK